MQETISFKIGKTYRLRTSPDFPYMEGGFLRVLAEIKPIDKWGARRILADCHLYSSVKGESGGESFLGVRCYVERGSVRVVDAYGERAVPTEIARVEGTPQRMIKAYAVDVYAEEDETDNVA